MDAREHMDVGPHHADLEDMSPLLPRHPAQEAAQEACKAGVDERLAVARGPDEVAIQAVHYGGSLGRDRSKARIILLRLPSFPWARVNSRLGICP